MKIFTLVLILILSGCSSTDNVARFEQNAVTMSHVDITYCESKGFKSFQDLGTYWSFICTDGRKFIVKHSG